MVTKKFDHALKDAKIPDDAIPDEVRTTAINRMVDAGDQPLDALDYATLKFERDAGWLESEESEASC